MLRLREPKLDRPFPAGSCAAARVIGALPTLLIIYAAFASRREGMAHMLAILLAY
jgi:hypothetical protein